MQAFGFVLGCRASCRAASEPQPNNPLIASAISARQADTPPVTIAPNAAKPVPDWESSSLSQSALRSANGDSMAVEQISEKVEADVTFRSNRKVPANARIANTKYIRIASREA